MTGVKLVSKVGKDGREYHIRKKEAPDGVYFGLQSRDKKGVERSTAFVRSLAKVVAQFNEK